MNIPDIFQKEVSEQVIQRIETLTPATPAVWGKMNVSQMLAHCSVTYEMVFTDKHPKPGAFMRFILKTMVKKKVVGESGYKQGSPTAPQFLITDQKEFETEKTRLIAYIRQVQEMGRAAFEGKESHSFGVLTAQEWNNMFYKHLNHHLSQFGA